jgi:hypothetical protein
MSYLSNVGAYRQPLPRDFCVLSSPPIKKREGMSTVQSSPTPGFFEDGGSNYLATVQFFNFTVLARTMNETTF